MTSVYRENKIQGGFSPSSRSGWSHRMEMEKMQVLCRSSQAPKALCLAGNRGFACQQRALHQWGARMGAGRHVSGPDPGPDRQVGDGRGCRDNQVSHCPGCRAWGHNQHPPSHTLDRSTGLFWVPQPIFSSMPTSTVEVLISLALSISASPSAFPPARLLSSSSSSPSSSSSRPSPAHGLTLSL